MEDATRNYAGPTCPGAGWHCVTATGPVVQVTGAGGTNRADCATPARCVVVQVAVSDGDNWAACVRHHGDSQWCSIAQLSTTGTNVADVVEVALGHGDALSATQGIAITQDATSGDNVASVLQTMYLLAGTRCSTAATVALDGHQTIAITQDATTGDNVVRGPGARRRSSSPRPSSRARRAPRP